MLSRYRFWSLTFLRSPWEGICSFHDILQPFLTIRTLYLWNILLILFINCNEIVLEMIVSKSFFEIQTERSSFQWRYLILFNFQLTFNRICFSFFLLLLLYSIEIDLVRHTWSEFRYLELFFIFYLSRLRIFWVRQVILLRSSPELSIFKFLERISVGSKILTSL